MVAAKKPSTAGSKLRTVRLDKIRLDGDTQSRVELDQDVIYEYAQLMKGGHEFPPILVVFDGASYWLVDGFHRRWAAVEAKVTRLKFRVVEGTREHARWLSYAANIEHGLRRSTEDKRKAVISALRHPKGAKMSDNKIAEHVGVSQPMVSKYREQLQSANKIYKVTERMGRDGKNYDTTNIGTGRNCSVENEEEQTPDTLVKLTPLGQLKYWWDQADETQRCLFRNWIDGNL